MMESRKYAFSRLTELYFPKCLRTLLLLDLQSIEINKARHKPRNLLIQYFLSNIPS